MIRLEAGLQNSLMVLELLRDKSELQDVAIVVGTFTNCRECGLTFRYYGNPSFTWCVYEHRNSDQIIVNGKEGYISLNGDLPYLTDDKHDYLAAFSWGRHQECADFLAQAILTYVDKQTEVV